MEPKDRREFAELLKTARAWALKETGMGPGPWKLR
jgi:hypothetical protein